MSALIKIAGVLTLLLLSTPALPQEPGPITFDGLWEVGQDYLRDNVDGYTETVDVIDMLSEDDAPFEPDFDPGEMPRLPGHCTEGPSETTASSLPDQAASSVGDDCSCYKQAYDELAFVRRYLEKLRAIYGSTTNYSSKMIAFGDSMAGIHGGFGVAWPMERLGIEESVINLGKTYDNKYDAYLVTLKAALMSIDQCEAQYHDEHNWYSRFGFIYYTFMADRYRRID